MLQHQVADCWCQIQSKEHQYCQASSKLELIFHLEDQECEVILNAVIILLATLYSYIPIK